MLPDPIVLLSTGDASPSGAAGASTSFARLRTLGLTTEYISVNGIASPTQPLYLRITQKKRAFGLLGVSSKYTCELEYHIDVPAVNGIPQADRPVKLTWSIDGNTIDLTAANRNRLLNVALGIEVPYGIALTSGQS